MEYEGCNNHKHTCSYSKWLIIFTEKQRRNFIVAFVFFIAHSLLNDSFSIRLCNKMSTLQSIQSTEVATQKRSRTSQIKTKKWNLKSWLHGHIKKEPIFHDIATLMNRFKHDIFTTCINIKMISTMSTKCTYMFWMNLAIKNKHFYEQHEEYDICNGNAVCLTWGKMWLFMYYSHELGVYLTVKKCT
jgi:hypothetical protein